MKLTDTKADRWRMVFMVDDKVGVPEKVRLIEHPVTKFLLLCLVIGFVCFSFSACKKEKKAEAEKLVNVLVWPAEIKKVQPYLETTGTLKPDEEVIVSSEVDGIVKNIYVEEGSPVTSGMLLVQINETDYRLDWQRSEAAMKQARASLVNTQSEYKRKEALYKEELITKQQFDDVSTRVALAQAELERSKATLAISRERLTRTRIYSPLRGAVKEKKVSIGNYVRNGTPLLQLIKTDPIKLNFTVAEKDMAGLKIGQEVAFTVDAFSDRQFKGRVNLIYPNIEERTRTLQAEAIVPNSSQILKPGSFARIFIYNRPPHLAVLAPLTSLMYDSGIIRIYIANGDVARERIVKIGNKYGEYVEIVEGLKEGELIVVAGQNNLSEGVKLNVAR